MIGFWMISSKHSGAMARITVALVDSGGLLLACAARNSMAILGESLVGQPSYDLVRCVQATGVLLLMPHRLSCL